MKETLTYFIDAIAYGVIFTITSKLLEYANINLNPIYIIIGTLVIFVLGKIGLKRFLGRKVEKVEK